MNSIDIINKYPLLFGVPPFNPKESLMCFGFDCSEFWYPAIEQMLSKLNVYIINNDIKDFKITQIKEKFASLSIYHNSYENQDIQNIIKEALIECSKICENCGKPATRKKINGWIKVICNECEELE